MRVEFHVCVCVRHVYLCVCMDASMNAIMYDACDHTQAKRLTLGVAIYKHNGYMRNGYMHKYYHIIIYIYI